mmetsp:Transcript_23690/g.56546  ORF Transcript_23690/g.56546 Transcript_23690/m.56546 type:complete len:273 (-) Transcript_23690:203-1021(-)
MGNTQTGRRLSGRKSLSEQSSQRNQHSSDGMKPGSPLTYTLQSPMEPLHKQAQQMSIGARSNCSFADFPLGWPNQPPLFPTVFYWSHGGSHVEVQGSFDNWTTRQELQRSGKDFTIVKLLPPGVYQYKFIVDGEWKYDPEQPAMFDEIGNVNNVLEVQEYTPDEYSTVQGFEPPASPPESYDCPLPMADDFTKAPPAMPPQLNLSLLNVQAPAHADNKSLPRPQHVILDHLYSQTAHTTVDAVVMGATMRYRSKYVTTVIYKPSKRVIVQQN